MRLVSWNCYQKFDRNYGLLHALDFDVAVVAECGPFEPGLDQVRELTSLMKAPLPNGSKYLGVFAQSPWQIEPLELDVGSLPWLLPARVTGPIEFTLLAVWPVDSFGSYTSQTAKVIADVLPHLAGQVILAGDLNAPISTSVTQHQRNVSALVEAGLISAFSHTRGASDDAITAEPTYYQHRREDLAFHIDHVFIPTAWASRVTMTVGDFSTWVGAGHSDHVPLIVDLHGC